MNQRSPLSEAKTKTLNFSFWRAEERLGVEESYQTIMHDFKGHSFNERDLMSIISSSTILSNKMSYSTIALFCITVSIIFFGSVTSVQCPDTSFG